MQCDARSKRTKQKCRAQAITGNSKCRHHGGRSRAGIGSATWKHGRYSKVIPVRMAARYDEARYEPELLELRHEIALVEARLVDVLSRVDSGESGQTWQAAHKAYEEFQNSNHDVSRARYWLGQLGLIIQRGQSDYAAWEEVGRLLDRKQRLAESERKRLIEQQQMMSYEEAMGLFQAIFSAVTRHVPDRSVREAIQADFAQLVNRPEPPLNGVTMKNGK